MDLGAHVIMRDERIMNYIKKNYGEVPRIRGVRFMKIETAIDCGSFHSQFNMFNKYVGKDVIYIHTRCGWYEGDEWSNYISCGWKEREDKNKGTFLESINDSFDGTYRDHYFKAIKGKEYKELLDLFIVKDKK